MEPRTRRGCPQQRELAFPQALVLCGLVYESGSRAVSRNLSISGDRNLGGASQGGIHWLTGGKRQGVKWALCMRVRSVTSVMSDSLWPYGLQPVRLLCPWNSPGKNTGVSLPCPSPGDLPIPGIEPMSLKSPALTGRFFTTSITWEANSSRLWPSGKPISDLFNS